MIIKGIISEDFINYKKPSLVIEFPYCNFKCGEDICQNKDLISSPNIEIDMEKILNKYYINNPITSAIVFQGLEPFDSYTDLIESIQIIREKTEDDIVIYSGYTKQELQNKEYLHILKNYKNIIIKYGRFIPNKNKVYDKILGVTLFSDNQYAEKIS